jgi:GNAT superfamily N-acetyltransferase
MIVEVAPYKYHRLLCRIASEHKATKGFSHIWYSAPTDYESNHVFTIREVGRFVGGIQVVPQIRAKPRCLLLNFIFITELYRSHGIGAKAMEWIEEHAKSCRLHGVVLRVQNDNEKARKFYERLGYLEVGPAFAGKGVEMRKLCSSTSEEPRAVASHIWSERLSRLSSEMSKTSASPSECPPAEPDPSTTDSSATPCPPSAS